MTLTLRTVLDPIVLLLQSLFGGVSSDARRLYLFIEASSNREIRWLAMQMLLILWAGSLLNDERFGLPMGRVDQKPSRRRPAGLFEGRIGDRHIFSVGAGLARDAGTSFYLEEHSAAIAGKPAPTRNGCCLRFLLLLCCCHSIIQATRMPLTEG
ncbi:hypothetical protein [Pseudomonas bubulae]|uniref:hypothetical protein n=1 Tax=Pseudomonas bubulae TaxID=2316085 RepID=UPI001F21D29D|nr:hypothetical protein [Pseudomonas bubulae]MCF3195252.1 hypothetical protein [Pseudomonas bubulae]